MALRYTKADIAEIDAAQFYKAIEDYVKVGKKDFAESINRKTRDAFLQASRYAPQATRARLRAKYKGAYAYFSKMAMEAKNGALTSYRAKYTKTAPDGTKKDYYRTRHRYFTNADRTNLYNATVQRTIKHSGFIRAYLKSCADYINRKCNLNSRKPARLTDDIAFRCTVLPATERGDAMSVHAEYGYLRKKGSSNIPDYILQNSLEKGFAIVAQDTREYIERKLSENAKAHSA